MTIQAKLSQNCFLHFIKIYFYVIFLQIPPGGLTCYACWVYLRRMVANDGQQNENAQQVEQVVEQEVEINANQCVRCLYSLARRRRHSLPAGPVRDEIAARISPRQVKILQCH